MAKSKELRRIPAIKVKQWLRDWNQVEFDDKERRTKPEAHFYLFSLPAAELRSLCGIFRREAKGLKPRGDDMGIQRQHDPERSDEIKLFVDYGYPWSTLSRAKRESEEYNDLRKPGWLPTAIVINILPEKGKSKEKKVATGDVVDVVNKGAFCELILPYNEWSKNWSPSGTPPFEVIDGQHRLWAFDGESKETSEFELPVVAFYDLDVSWQAYLFWTINIKPKRINPSLAFDLYPLLRAEDWLERAEEHIVYRDTRSQELTEALWSYPDSPWYDKINMLGEKQNRWVTQSAWIRNISASFVKPWDKRQGRSGGLFGERLGSSNEVLGWNRAQQAAFLIYAWSELREAIHASNDKWAKALRTTSGTKQNFKLDEEPGFYSAQSLVVTDQGVRCYLQVINDICYALAPKLKLDEWSLKAIIGPVGEEAISKAMKSVEDYPVAKVVKKIARELASFDWRTSAAHEIDDPLRQLKLTFRGGSGYKELRRQLLKQLIGADGDIGTTAKSLFAAIGK